MTKNIRILLLFALFCLLVPTGASALSTSAASAVLMDAERGEVLFAENAADRHLIASTTKIMTAAVALQHYAPTETVRVSGRAAATEGSSMYLKSGETLTVEELLSGLLLQSGNDAAEALAEHAGDRELFIAWMNDLAEELGMENTSFENPSGLDGEKHYSTAYDMALLACYAMQEPTLSRIVSTSHMETAERSMYNHNKLLSRVEGCVGLKTGYTRAAGRTLVSAAERNGQRLIAVTLCDGNDWADHEAMYEYGFRYGALTSALAAWERARAYAGYES